MSSSESVVVAEPPKVARKRKQKDSPARPKKLPPYAVVVYNDEEHTFQYVAETFSKVFAYPFFKSFALAWQIHVHGRGIVWSGSKEVAELKRDQIRSAGPDFYASHKVDFPLGVTIEPLPG